ncbi:hypothetical protein P7K49_016900 [Saguinus oedipus]|uniref:Uncharacterized protein n=1 Tax=Saguinus oedipus TaxID=9490 RepID=A0ABQ9VDP6_SAGOE|nr:hypothetical protein P7K49_016900 [Saguinus oedipus]
MRSEKKREETGTVSEKQQKQQLFQRKKQQEREGRKKAKKGGDAQVPVGVKGAGTSDLGGDQLQKKLSLGAVRPGRKQCCQARLQGTAGWRLPCPQQRGTGQGPREVGEVAPGAEAAELSPRRRRDWLLPGTVATTSTQNLAYAFPDSPHLQKPHKTGKGRRRRQLYECLQQKA